MERLIVCTVGTGIGAGVILDGEIVRLRGNIAGSLGHVVVDAPRVVHLTDALLSDGFTRREIEAIMGRNALRVIGKVLPPGGAAQPGEGHR